ATKKGKCRRQTRPIRNGMDESEASKAQKRCSQCGALSHNYKKCPQNALHDAADVGPSRNPRDGAPPTFKRPSARIARGRHSVSCSTIVSNLFVICSNRASSLYRTYL